MLAEGQSLQGTAWEDQAKCQGLEDPFIFQAPPGERSKPAKAVCQLCDVRVDCLDYALANNENFGVWGGLDEVERQALKNGTKPDDNQAEILVSL